MVFSLRVFHPSKLIHIAVKVEGFRCFEGKSLHFLNLGFEDIETHTIYRVLETGILFRRSVISTSYQPIDELCDYKPHKYCVGFETHKYVLSSITVIPLNEEDGFSRFVAMLRSNKSKNVAKSRIRLFIGMSYAHSTTRSDVKPNQATSFASYGDKADVIGKHIHIIIWRDSEGYFELRKH
jgi:hypothetical protein